MTPKEGQTVKAFLVGGGWITAYFINGSFYPTQIPAFLTEKLNITHWEKI